MKTKIFTVVISSFIFLNCFAQNGKYGATPEDSVTCIENLSLYLNPYFNNEQYSEAVKYWSRDYEPGWEPKV